MANKDEYYYTNLFNNTAFMWTNLAAVLRPTPSGNVAYLQGKTLWQG